VNIFKKFRKRLETYLARLGLFILPRLPREFILVLARVTGRAAYFLARGQRRVTMANLEIAFGHRKTPAEKRRIALNAFQNMALVFLDFFWFARQTRERIKKYVSMDKSVPDYFPPPPAVVVTAHFGNWELMSRAFTAHGYLHVAIVAPLANPAVDEMFNQFRAAGDAEIVPMQGAVRGALRAMRRGLLVAILLDQNTKPEEGGVFVDFFGLPCPISSIAGALALREKIPIIAVFCRVQANGYYTFYSLPQFKIDYASANVEAINRLIAATFQDEIGKYPEQWMWMYKRWKHIKPGMSASAYPYYAKPLRKT
jgi:KDO2-lipid IV(A) lauroyltransferase